MMLCEWCAQIPFDPNVLSNRLRLNGSVTYTLGSGARLEKSLCVFCWLVVRAISEGGGEVSECRDVRVSWSSGPGGYYAFQTPDSIGTYIAFRRTTTSVGLKALSVESTGPHVDTARVLRWTSSCEQTHGPACALSNYTKFADTFRGLHLLRLIDTMKDCLVEKRSFEKYIALSYVWGSVTNFRLTKANRTTLLAPGSLTKVSNLLPKTIKDTIVLARRLGCRYLWVDALCLLQNDNEDLDRGVNAMDRIYECAWLTVVAGCGHDANARLPGVLNPRRPSRNTVEIEHGVEMGLVTELHVLLQKSVHNTRAWTFQELVLSRRTIYFVGDKVFYRCRAAEHGELYTDIPSHKIGHDGTLGSMFSSAVLMQTPIIDYNTLLFYYTQRALTEQNDAPRAMAGITRRFMEVLRCRFLEGLPTAVFDGFIIFHAHDRTLHRRSSFPSYSWTGWRGGVRLNLHGCLLDDYKSANDWLRMKTWIIWYKRSRSGTTSLVWDPCANDSFPSQDVTCVGYRERCSFSDGWWTAKHGIPKRTMPTEETSFSRAVPAYPILQFWTLSVYYNITDIDVFEATGYLTDRNDVKCGFASLDGFEETSFFESGGPFEVILLSEADENEGYLTYSKNLANCRYPKIAGRLTYYNVLLLEWQGGIAERRGFGHLYQGAVKRSLSPGPSWKEIFLA